MNVTCEEKKVEALERMKMLKIFPETVKQFKNDGLISISEPPVGAFFWVEDEKLKAIREFEEKHNALVYMVVRTYTTYGKMDSYLFVSDYKEEWEMDREDLAEGIVFTYTVNYDMPDCSEFGSIGIERTVGAGLKRTF